MTSDGSELREVADAFRASLPKRGDVLTFRIDALDRTGIPVVQASLLLSSEPATIGYGYGFSEVEAEVGALGELCEEVHVGEWMHIAPRVVASYAELRRARGERGVADPLTLCLPAGSPYAPDMPLPWVEARRFPSDETVMVPREWVAAYPYQLREAARLIMPITNGLGAGFDYPHAIAHGLMELLQRDGNAVAYRALDQGVAVDMDTATEPEVAALLGKLQSLGIAVTVKLAAADFGIANLYVVGDDPKASVPVQITACGEAAHPDRARSLRKALLEFCGSRARKAATHGPIDTVRRVMPRDMVERQLAVAMTEEEENRALEAMAEWVAQDAAELRRRLAGSVFANRTHVAFSALPDADPGAVTGSEDRLHWLAGRLHAAALDILWVDCSPPGSQVKVVKTIVPGLESETMSYGRIGWRGVRRLRERCDPLLLDAPREGAQRVRLRPADEERAGGPAWFDARLADHLVAGLYPLYRESGPFSAQLLLQRRRGAA
ncbi:MAG: YcaO-like family protein [Acetobacteraceae bacterium]|nr:YcaO-like family protein [Acetobacteraceae bacterium]